MADEADLANDLADQHQAAIEAAIRLAARSMPAGEPGVCEGCEQDSPRLVGGLCARCRDAQVRR